jgi:AraC family transcriptional regulator
MFELEKIGTLGGFDWNWQDIDLSRTFDIQNYYLLMGMRKLAEEAISPGFASDMQIESTLTVMGIELRRQLLDQSPLLLNNQHCLGKQQLSRVRDYIYSHLNNQISVGDIASVCDMAPREVSEQFKQSTGMTLRHFIASARVDKAKSLLTARTMMIKQVGFECGFKASAAFVAAFRKTTGFTPADYRNRFC